MSDRNSKFFNNSEYGISIRVSIGANPEELKIEYFDYDAVQNKDEENLESEDKIAGSLTVSDVKFYSNTWWISQIKKKLKDSPDVELEKDQISSIVDQFTRTAEDVIPGLVESRKSTEDEDDNSEATIIDENIEVDEEWVEERAKEYIKRPELLSFIDRTIHHHLAGETSNALLTFLAMVSTKTVEPSTLRPTGESSIGKTFLVTRVAKLIPEDMKVVRKGFSEKAVWNKGKPLKDHDDRRVWNLHNKVIILLEEETSEEFLEQFRPVLSHDEKKITYEVTNTESKSRETLKVDIHGWPSYIGMRVGDNMDDQEDTRAMKMTPDSGKAKYDKAVSWDAHKRETPWIDKKRKSDTEIAKKIVSMLDRYKILIPFRTEMQKHFPTERRRHMRDWTQFQSLVEAMTVLHQKQRPKIEIEGEEYLIAHPDDVKSVIMIARDALAETLHGLDSRLRTFWRHMRKVGKINGYKGLLREYKNCFGEETSKTTLREKYISKLEDIGMVRVDEGSGSKSSEIEATGTMTTMTSQLDNLVKCAYDFDIENSTFAMMLSGEHSPSENPKVKECEWMDKNPCELENIEKVKEFWNGFTNFESIVEENKDLLETSYEDDYEGEDPLDMEEEVYEEVKAEKKKEEVEVLGKLPLEDLEEKISEIYKEVKAEMSVEGLEYPNMADFSIRASEKLDEDRDRVLEACKELSNKKNNIIFDTTDMPSEYRSDDEDSIEIEIEGDEED